MTDVATFEPYFYFTNAWKSKGGAQTNIKHTDWTMYSNLDDAVNEINKYSHLETYGDPYGAFDWSGPTGYVMDNYIGVGSLAG